MPVNLSYKLGYDLLGPVFRFYCHRLRLIEQFKQVTPFLFLSRGGLRMHYFYEQYLLSNGLEPVAPKHDFYISRMAAFRALLADQSNYAMEEIAKEYYYQTIAASLSYFLPAPVYQNWKSATTNLDQANGTHISAGFFRSMLESATPEAIVFQEHVNEQKELLRKYFESLHQGRQEVILVDTGWSGSIVQSLQELFPETTFTAAFFGRFNYGKVAPPWFNSITGLVMQHEHFNPTNPQSCFVFHRHLIESLCEPAWPSVEGYRVEQDEIVPTTGIMPESVKKPGESEVIAKAVADFLIAEPAISPENVIAEYNSAIKKLARIITRPNKEEAVALGVSPRSRDFGRDEAVPVLIETSQGNSKLQRIKQSLWRQGQAALEFDGLRLPVQWGITLDKTSNFLTRRMQKVREKILHRYERLI